MNTSHEHRPTSAADPPAAPEAAPPRPRSGAISCEIWWTTRYAAHNHLVQLLDPIERARLTGFSSPADAALYLVTHALARIVLGTRVGLPPSEVIIDRTCSRCGEPHGKPAVADHPIHYSVAHSGIWAAVAVTTAHQVGVDIEQLHQRLHTASLRQGALTHDEQRELDRLPAPQRHDALLTYWTRKEAVLKATGDGLSTWPTQLHVTPPHTPPRLLHGPATWDSARPIHLADLSPARPYVGALAILAPRPPQITESDGTALLTTPRHPYAATRSSPRGTP